MSSFQKPQNLILPMKALILSNLKLTDFLNDLNIKTIKSIEKDINSLCFVVDKESDVNILRIERILKGINTQTFVIKIRRNASERRIIKNAVRFLKTFNHHDQYFYSNDLNQIQKLRKIIEKNYNNSASKPVTLHQFFSKRNVNYGNIYHLQNF